MAIGTLTVVVMGTDILYQESIRTGSEWGARRVSRYAASLAMTPGALVSVTGINRSAGRRRIVRKGSNFYTRCI